MKAVILAGGSGTRLWPLSRDNFPKQFLNFGSGFSLLQKTVKRLIEAPFISQVVVATNELLRPLVQEQLDNIGATHCRILVEPFRRNTAPAIGLALKVLQTDYQTSNSDQVLIVPSDHLIEPEASFLEALQKASDCSKKTNQIVTFGIRPTKPETGYGYIEVGEKWNEHTFQTLRFIEKPNQETAQKFLNNPHFYWNSGIFLFSVQTFWDELSLHAPHLSSLFEVDLSTIIGRFHELPDLSIDYAIMEKSKNILLYPLSVMWSDVGSWDSVYEVMAKDQDHNVKIGKVLSVDTKNSLIIGGRKLISAIGLEDLLIIETEEAILISKRGRSQQIKTLLKEFKEKLDEEQIHGHPAENLRNLAASVK